MQKLIDYATSFDPKFPSRIRGSSRNDIDAFAALIGERYPTSTCASSSTSAMPTAVSSWRSTARRCCPISPTSIAST